MKKLGRALVVGLALLLPGAAVQAQQLVSSAAQTFSPKLAVSSDGGMVAAWFQGPGPCLTSYACDLSWTGAGGGRHRHDSKGIWPPDDRQP
jgi:hypothetical protein